MVYVEYAKRPSLDIIPSVAILCGIMPVRRIVDPKLGCIPTGVTCSNPFVLALGWDGATVAAHTLEGCCQLVSTLCPLLHVY